MTDRPIIFSAPMVRALLAGRKTQTRRLVNSPLSKCQPGDRLWVREAWQLWGEYDRVSIALCNDAELYPDVNYLADGNVWKSKKRSPIHMPRRASRLTLTITEVRTQRLQDITEADALAEGFFPIPESPTLKDPRRVFECFWDLLHGGDSWFDNPAVVALTFTRSMINIDSAVAS